MPTPTFSYSPTVLLRLLVLAGIVFVAPGCGGGNILGAQLSAPSVDGSGEAPGAPSGPASDPGSTVSSFTVNTEAVATSGVYLTSHDLSSGLTSMPPATGVSSASSILTLDDTQRYQIITGFGASLTDSSSYLMSANLDDSAKKSLMVKLFDPTSGIGLTFLRQPMGASDFSSIGNFSYDDTANDTGLIQFNVTQDKKYTLPLLKDARALSPELFILATPWSAPGWMKATNTMNGGSLASNNYASYANYFVKTYQAYKDAGVLINAFTPQNEPLNNNGSYPTMTLPANEEGSFVGQQLGPALKAAAPLVAIWGYDHNWDRPDYPTTLVNDSKAFAYMGAVAWHCYAGNASAMGTFHQQYPDLDQHMTECAGGSWQGDPLANTIDLLIDSTNNWAKSVTLWNIALDAAGGPTNGGCPTCRGVVTIDSSNAVVTFNADYYALGHFSKFVRPGAVRIGLSQAGGNLSAVAFKNPNGALTTVVHNKASSPTTVAVVHNAKSFHVSVPANGIATFVMAGIDAQ